ncbi:hypothetical protein CDL15_Pgr027990 [Punica granatum]|uniref:DCD domain-containing protein n=1 Tax=Punica granatum TaxID=22663 RepID=A0A218XJR5_PUNGR|nr:hypothetical protein CDL15_Pgr027990 [Punica granatum]
MENNQQSFWQFSDQLRVHTSNLASLSLNDSIWSNNFASSKRPEDRRNFDVRVGGSVNSSSTLKPPKASDLNLPAGNDPLPGKDFNGFNFGWKMGAADAALNDLNVNGFDDGWKVGSIGSTMNVGVNNDAFNKGIYPKPMGLNYPMNGSLNLKGARNNRAENDHKGSKKSGGRKNGDINNNSNSEGKSGADKRFKTLPPSESLPRNETVGGYIFVCNNDTMQENLQRELFGLPPRYRDSVRQITPGLPLFLYNYSTHQLHGVFEAASFGGSNIDPSAWEDKKCLGESRFPAQVRVITRKVCEPLEEDSFRPILHHYDGPKFRLELNIPEVNRA